MRTLTTTLETAQEKSTRKQAIKLVLTSGDTSYTIEEDRILGLTHTESENSHRAVVDLQNADGYFTDLSLKGYSAALYHGLVTTAGKEYSLCAPLTVLDQKLDSARGMLRCNLQLIGMPDLLQADKANADYEHDSSSAKTVKDLVSEIASGTAVSEELTESQETGGSYYDLYSGGVVVAGQRLDITDRTVTKLSFKLKKIGIPSGNITYKIYDMDAGALASKVLSDASALDGTGTWYEAELDTPVELDGDYLIYVEFTSGDPSNYIQVAFSTESVKSDESFVAYTGAQSPGDADTEFALLDCCYRYKYEGSGISVYDHCTSYDVEYDSEDSLIDSYCPKDSFTIREGEDRLAVIDKLLFHTACQRIFKADGKIHVLTPTISGTTYASEYSLASGHPFFSKAIRDALVIPNREVVRSLKDDSSSYEGVATSAASYALLPKSHFTRTSLESDAQAAALAAAIISRSVIAAQQGSATIPVNVGSELYDYVLVTDVREGDSRAGNLGQIVRMYKNYPGRQPEYNMSFSLGRVASKSVAGTRASSLATRGITQDTDGAIPWGELYALLDDMTANLQDINVALGWTEAQTPAQELIDETLATFLKNQIEHFEPTRALNTLYQNTGGKIRIVVGSVYCSLSGASGSSYIEVQVGLTSSVSNIHKAGILGFESGGVVFEGEFPFMLLVKSGWYYKIVSHSGVGGVAPALTEWHEYDLG